MLKYPNIIQQLSKSDKAHILCDITLLDDKKYRVLGIPSLRIAQLQDFCGNDIPSPIAMANTWDAATVEYMANHAFRSMAEQGVDLAIIPGPKLKINPYRTALSEDSLLSYAICASYVRAAAQYGISVLLDGLYLKADELRWLDSQPNPRVLQEMLLRPFGGLLNDPTCKGVITAQDLEEEDWKDVNQFLRNTLAQQAGGRPFFFLRRQVASENTVALLNQGGLCFQGSALALESALDRYQQLSISIEHGGTTAEELELDMLHGRAIPPEKLDEATDRLLDFLFHAKRKPTVSTVYTDPRVLSSCAAASGVLLKNEQMLPLQPGNSLCMIGDIVMTPQPSGNPFYAELATLLLAQGFNTIGASRGYDLTLERSDSFIAPAVELAGQADVVLLFLGLGSERERTTHKTTKISIPANQQALLSKLAEHKKKIIAILPPDSCPDIVLPQNCAAILLCPLQGQFSARMLCDLLIGAINPSGKLASTVYCGTEALYRRHHTYKLRDGMKIGTFLGYRYYDSAEDYPLFPFGHGLSYSEFSYSQLEITGNVAKFTVTNRSKVAGTEIPQLYIGKPDSAVIRPRKELAGFQRIELAPGEKKTVQIPFSLPVVYDVSSHSFVEEAGRYIAYVGSSIAHTPLQHSFSAGTTALTADHQRRSDYIRSESNILSDHFKLEAKYNIMKKSVFNYVFGGVLLLLAIVLKMYCAYAAMESGFFDLFAIALSIVGITLLVSEAMRQNRLRSQEQVAIDQASRQEFADANAQVIPCYNAESMFVQEFDIAEQAAPAQEAGIEGVEADLVAYIDKDQDFASAVSDFMLFAAQRGCRFSQQTARDLMSSLASSRLLVLRGMSDKDFRKFMVVLSSYFGTSAYIDWVTQNYVKQDSMLFRTDIGDTITKTNTMLAMEAAQNNKHMVHFAALDHVIPENLPLYFIPFVNYARNPLGTNRITIPNAYGVNTSYQLPQNLWFVLNLEHGHQPCALPDYVSEVAVINHFSFENCPVDPQPAHVRRFSYHQMEFLAERAVNHSSIPEDLWRKLDQLERYVNKHTPFAIHNKTWLCLEKYAYVYMTCQGEMITALDHAICAKLMTQVITALQGSMTPEDRPLEETIDLILGEDWPIACKKLIQECNAKQA